MPPKPLSESAHQAPAVAPGLMELTPCTGCASKRGAAARRPSPSKCAGGRTCAHGIRGHDDEPDEFDGRRRWGRWRRNRFRRLLRRGGSGLRLGFRTTLAAGFLVVVAGFAGAGVCATETGASRHAATRAAARFKAREDEASMAADSTRDAASRAHNLRNAFRPSGAACAAPPGGNAGLRPVHLRRATGSRRNM